MRREPRPLRSPVFDSGIRRTRRQGSRRPPPRLPTRLFTKPAHSRIQTAKLWRGIQTFPADQVERGRSPDYQDFTTSSVFRGTGQPTKRSALLTTNWRGCERRRRLRRPVHPYTKAPVDAVPKGGGGPTLRFAATLPGAVETQLPPRSGCRFAPRCSYAVRKCHELEPQRSRISGEHGVACHLAAG
jgi:oligopeptide/dipeptide ABC transporter ATP-binding protein